MKKKEAVIGVSVLIFTIISAILIWQFWEPIKSFFTGSTYYTQEQVDEIKKGTWQEAIKKEQEYLSKINELNNLITQNNFTIEQLQQYIGELESDKANSDETIASLESTISSLQEQNQEKENKINELNNSISTLNSQIDELKAQASKDQLKIESLTKEVASLTTERDQLLELKEQNSSTINTLNILVEELKAQAEASDQTKIELENQIASLQASIETYLQDIENYKQIIEDLKALNTSVVTFEVDGQVIETQQVKKTESPTEVEAPVSEDYIFNGWVVKGTSEIVDPFTYSVTQDITFVADITKYYQVKFTVNNENVSTQRVLGGQFAEDVTVEDNENFVFNYWTVNGVKVETVSTYEIVSNTEFVANLSYYRTVTYKDGTEVLGTEKVLEGNKIQEAPEVSSVEHFYTFKGWKLNNQLIDTSIYVVNNDIELIAEKVYENVAVRYYSADIQVNDFYIYDIEDISALANFVNTQKISFAYKKIKLANDIDLQSYEFVPIGTSTNKFGGAFDGQGYTIKNLTINKADTDYVGFFGYVDSSYVSSLENVVFENANIQGHDYVGTLAGYSRYAIKKVNVSGNVAGNGNVGGIVGKIYNSIISKSSNFAKVSGTSQIGGLTGSYSVSSSEYGIIDSYNTGNIVATGNYVGGLCGYNESNTNYLYFVRCYNAGKIEGASYVSGLQGASVYEKYYLCFNVGEVSGTGIVSGIATDNNNNRNNYVLMYGCYSVGKLQGESVDLFCASEITLTLENCKYNGVSQSQYGGTKDSTLSKDSFKQPSLELFTNNDYAGTKTIYFNAAAWDFENVWYSNGAELPVLR